MAYSLEYSKGEKEVAILGMSFLGLRDLFCNCRLVVRSAEVSDTGEGAGALQKELI